MIPQNETHKQDFDEKEVNAMKLTVDENGVYLNKQEIPFCTRVDIKNICPGEGMEAVLHVFVTEADVQWPVRCRSGNELSAM